MELLLLGLVIWSLVHLFSAVAPQGRIALVGRLGLMPYKGVVSLLILLALLLMVLGWRSVTTFSVLFVAPPWLTVVAGVLIFLGLVLLAASNLPTNLKRWVRHPQLTGVILWALAHGMLNGDSRSLLLFGGLLVWAVLEIVFINRRDGIWGKVRSGECG